MIFMVLDDCYHTKIPITSHYDSGKQKTRFPARPRVAKLEVEGGKGVAHVSWLAAKMNLHNSSKQRDEHHQNNGHKAFTSRALMLLHPARI